MNEKSDWKHKAYSMYFNKHMKIKDIAEEICISRQHTAKYLKSFSLYNIEKENRKKESLKRHKESKKNYDNTKRNRYSQVTQQTIYREHEEAVRCLSREKYN